MIENVIKVSKWFLPVNSNTTYKTNKNSNTKFKNAKNSWINKVFNPRKNSMMFGHFGQPLKRVGSHHHAPQELLKKTPSQSKKIALHQPHAYVSRVEQEDCTASTVLTHVASPSFGHSWVHHSIVTRLSNP